MWVRLRAGVEREGNYRELVLHDIYVDVKDRPASTRSISSRAGVFRLVPLLAFNEQ